MPITNISFTVAQNSHDYNQTLLLCDWNNRKFVSFHLDAM